MKAVVQRVLDASVSVNEEIVGKIGNGLLVYLGVAKEDTAKDADWLADKIANLRIFEDSDEKMNLSVKEIIHNEVISVHSEIQKAKIGVLAVSQFTLLADARKGRRPSYGNAAEPETAKKLYEYLIKKIQEQGLLCESGIFQAHMKVTYTNDGPVTILLDTREPGYMSIS